MLFNVVARAMLEEEGLIYCFYVSNCGLWEADTGLKWAENRPLTYLAILKYDDICRAGTVGCSNKSLTTELCFLNAAIINPLFRILLPPLTLSISTPLARHSCTPSRFPSLHNFQNKVMRNLEMCSYLLRNYWQHGRLIKYWPLMKCLLHLWIDDPYKESNQGLSDATVSVPSAEISHKWLHPKIPAHEGHLAGWAAHHGVFIAAGLTDLVPLNALHYLLGCE